MKNSKGKRIIALVGVILIGLMAVATLAAAIFDKTGMLFRSFLIVTIALPIALWVFMWSWGAMTNRHTMASFDLGASDSNQDEEIGSEDTDKE